MKRRSLAKIIETFSEEKVSDGVKLKAWEYLGKNDNGEEIIGDFVDECETVDGGFDLNIDNCSSNYVKLFIAHPDSSYYQAERYVNLEDEMG